MRRQRATLGNPQAAATRGTMTVDVGPRVTGGFAAFPAPEAAQAAQAAHNNATTQASPTPRTPQSDRAYARTVNSLAR